MHYHSELNNIWTIFRAQSLSLQWTPTSVFKSSPEALAGRGLKLYFVDQGPSHTLVWGFNFHLQKPLVMR